MKFNSKDHLPKILFFALTVIFMGYILRWVFPFNIEITLTIILILSIYVVSVRGCRMIPKSIFIWILLMTLFWSFNVGISLWHDSDIGVRTLRLINTYSLVFGFAAVAILIGLIRPSIDYFWYLIAMSSLVLLSAFVYELIHLGMGAITNGYRFGAITSQSISFGVVASTFFIILLGSISWAFKKGWVFFLVWIILLIAVLGMTFLSQTRTAWIGLLSAIIIWFFYYGVKMYRADGTAVNKLGLLVISIAILSSIFSSSYLEKIVEKRVILVTSEFNSYIERKKFNTSVGARLIMYEALLTTDDRYFWLGLGTENFPAFLKDGTQRVAAVEFQKEFNGYSFTTIHNQFLMNWLMHGVFAFLSVLAFFVFMFIHFYKGFRNSAEEHKSIWIAGLAYCIATFISFLPESMLHSVYNFSHFFMVSSILVAYTATLNSKTSKEIN